MEKDIENQDSMHYIKIIGSNIRFERKKRNLTIEDLAEIIGMAPGFLGLIERGQRGTSIKNLVKIADIFSLSLDQLITIDLRSLELNGMREPGAARKARTAKLSTLNSLMKSMSEAELEYLVANIKALRKLTRSSAKDEVIDQN